jgi:spore germination protein GerM
MNTEDRLRQMIDAARAEVRPTEADWDGFISAAHRPLYARRAATALGAVALVVIGAFAAQALISTERQVRQPVVGSPGDSTSPTPSPTPEEPTTAQVPTSERETWYVREERLSWGTSGMGGEVPIAIAGDDPAAQEAAFWLQTLVAGTPMPAAEEGDSTAIPEGTEILGVAIEGSLLEVDLSSEFESGGGSLSMQLRVAQVVYTGTQFEGIDAVRILIDGDRRDALGGEGIAIAEPLTRRDFEDFAPNVVPETPKPGEAITSPVTVSGFANVFEANVVIQVTDKNGDVLVETFTTATCGSGCWGDFMEEVAFEVTERQRGRVNVFTYSAEDGSPQDVISSPVILVP